METDEASSVCYCVAAQIVVSHLSDSISRKVENLEGSTPVYTTVVACSTVNSIQGSQPQRVMAEMLDVYQTAILGIRPPALHLPTLNTVPHPFTIGVLLARDSRFSKEPKV
jgi:hypothetical protein